MSSALDAVRGAASPRAALEALARRIDQLEAAQSEPQLDSWAGWSQAPEGADTQSTDAVPPPAQPKADAAPPPVPPKDDFWIGPDGVIESRIDWRPQDGVHSDERYDFATFTLELDKALHDVNAIDHYVKGGPMWLYITNRDLVMTYPLHVRQQMAFDIGRYDHAIMTDFCRDALRSFDNEADLSSPAMRLGDG